MLHLQNEVLENDVNNFYIFFNYKAQNFCGLYKTIADIIKYNQKREQFLT